MSRPPVAEPFHEQAKATWARHLQLGDSMRLEQIPGKIEPIRDPGDPLVPDQPIRDPLPGRPPAEAPPSRPPAEEPPGRPPAEKPPKPGEPPPMKQEICDL